MKKKYLCPENFTQKIGAYSHGISVDLGKYKMIFITGQIAMDKWGKAIAPKSIRKQTEFVFKNIEEILAEDNATFKHVVKAVIYVTDMSQFPEISKIRNKYFADSKPVSTLVEINKTVKKGCDVEIEVIAIKEK